MQHNSLTESGIRCYAKASKSLSEELQTLRIDADAHVLETEETWKYMDGSDLKFRPDIVGSVE